MRSASPQCKPFICIIILLMAFFCCWTATADALPQVKTDKDNDRECDTIVAPASGKYEVKAYYISGRSVVFTNKFVSIGDDDLINNVRKMSDSIAKSLRRGAN